MRPRLLCSVDCEWRSLCALHDVVSAVSGDCDFGTLVRFRSELRLSLRHDTQYDTPCSEIFVRDAFNIGSADRFQLREICAVMAGVSVKDEAIVERLCLAQIRLKPRY